MRVGPSPMARAISTASDASSPPAIDVPSPVQLDGDRGQEPSPNGRRLIGHAGERLLEEGEGLLADEPDLRRSAEGARIRAARARRWGSPRVRATSAAAKTVGSPPRVPGIAEGRGQVDQQVTAQLEGRSVEQLQQAEGAVEVTDRGLEGELGRRLGRGPPGDVDRLLGVTGQRPFAVVVGEGVEVGVGAGPPLRSSIASPTRQCMRTRRLVEISSWSAERTSAWAKR